MLTESGAERLEAVSEVLTQPLSSVFRALVGLSLGRSMLLWPEPGTQCHCSRGAYGSRSEQPRRHHIGGFVDVFDAFEVDSLYVSGDPKGTLTYNTFMRGVRYEGSELEVVRAGRRM